MTIQLITTGSFSSPPVLTRDGHRTVALVTVDTSPNFFIQLPSGCLPDDIFEIYWTPTDSAGAVMAPSGEDFGPVTGGQLRTTSGGNTGAKILKKLTGTTWAVVNGAPN